MPCRRVANSPVARSPGHTVRIRRLVVDMGKVAGMIKWLGRERVLLAGMAIAVSAGGVGARTGLNGFTAVLGFFGAFCILAIGLKRPQWTPYIMVAFAIFDRDLRLSQDVQITSLMVVLLLLAPGFIKVMLAANVLPRFALIGAGMLILGLMLASMASALPELAWSGMLRWIPALIMIGGVATLCSEVPGLPRRMGIAILGGGTVSGVFGLLQSGGHYWLVGPPYVEGVRDSTFGYYTNFANCEALAAVIGIGLIIGGIQQRRKLPLVVAACTLLCLYMVETSYSRGAVILVGAGLGVILLRLIGRPSRFVLAVLGLALAAWLVTVLAPAEYVNEIIAKFTNSQNGDIVRNQLQAGGFEVLKQSPLGIGFNNFSALVASGDVYSTLALAHSHNTFIQMGLDAGWLGGAGFLVLVIGASLRSFRAKGNTMVVAFGAALGGYLVQVSQDYFFFEEASLVLFCLLIAGAMSRPRLENPSNSCARDLAVSSSRSHI